MTLEEKLERGKRLSEAIKHRGLTQTAFAKQAYMSQVNINNICKGKTALTNTNAVAFAKLLEVDPDYLLLTSDYMDLEDKKIVRELYEEDYIRDVVTLVEGLNAFTTFLRYVFDISFEYEGHIIGVAQAMSLTDVEETPPMVKVVHGNKKNNVSASTVDQWIRDITEYIEFTINRKLHVKADQFSAFISSLQKGKSLYDTPEEFAERMLDLISKHKQEIKEMEI